MAEYTYEDIIMDPDDPRLEGAIGKECYFSDFPKLWSPLAFRVFVGKILHFFPFELQLRSAVFAFCLYRKTSVHDLSHCYSSSNLLHHS